MQKFAKKLNKFSTHYRMSTHFISIDEYMIEGKKPEELFQKTVESGQICDGVVVSGNHPGSFGGKRANGKLGIDFMERLVCEEKYNDWFSNVKALWLQGCRTLGIGEKVSEEESSADYHTSRVGAILEEDHLEQSFADLNIEFSATLDQDNPMFSRYLRLFPSANVFGWTKKAPGKKSGSEYSIPFHIAHIAKQLSQEDRFPKEGPLEEEWSEESTRRYWEVMVAVLSGEEQYREAVLAAWNEHGNVRDQSTEYGFFNPDLTAYPAINGKDETLKQAKHYNCVLKVGAEEELPEALDRILENPVFIGYTYNSLLDRLKDLKEQNPELHSWMIAGLRESEETNFFLVRKLTSDRLGILSKIDYYTFYEEVYGRKENLRSLILDKVEELFKKIPSETREERDYKKEFLSSLLKHGYLNSDKGIELLRTVIQNENASSVRVTAIETLGRIDERVLPMVKQIIKEENEDMRAAAAVAAVELGESALPTVEQALKDESLKVRAAVLNTARRVGEEGFLMLEQVMAKIGDNALFKLLEEAIKNPKNKSAQFTAVDFSGRLGGRGVLILKLALKDDNQKLHFHAARTAGDIGEKGLPILEQTIRSPDKEVRSAAVASLGKLGQKGLPLLKEALDYDFLNKEEKMEIQRIIDELE